MFLPCNETSLYSVAFVSPQYFFYGSPRSHDQLGRPLLETIFVVEVYQDREERRNLWKIFGTA